MNRSGDVPVLSVDLLAKSQSAKIAPSVQTGFLTFGSTYLPRLPILFNRTVACCGVRPRLQRRARPRFKRGFLLSYKQASEHQFAS